MIRWDKFKKNSFLPKTCLKNIGSIKSNPILVTKLGHTVNVLQMGYCKQLRGIFISLSKLLVWRFRSDYLIDLNHVSMRKMTLYQSPIPFMSNIGREIMNLILMTEIFII